MHLYIHATTAAPHELFIQELPINWYDNPFMHQKEDPLAALFHDDAYAFEPVLVMIEGVPYSLLAWTQPPGEAADAHLLPAHLATSVKCPPIKFCSLDLQQIPLEDLETIGHALDAHYGKQCPERLLASGWGVLTPEYNRYDEDRNLIWGKYIMACRSDARALWPIPEDALDKCPDIRRILTRHALKGAVLTATSEDYQGTLE